MSVSRCMSEGCRNRPYVSIVCGEHLAAGKRAQWLQELREAADNWRGDKHSGDVHATLHAWLDSLEAS